MSSQFSYELDERQIRLTMQDAELPFNESAWNRFEQISESHTKKTISVNGYSPKFNLGISRSIIVPVMFVTLIGGLSAMLFSFIDFKKKEAIETEVPYVAKVEPVKAPVQKPKVVVAPKVVETPTANIVSNSAVSTTVASTPTLVVAKPVETKTQEQAKVIETKPQPTATIAENEVKKPTPSIPKKNKIKAKPEILPTITTPNTAINLNEGSAEPELDLK